MISVIGIISTFLLIWEKVVLYMLRLCEKFNSLLDKKYHLWYYLR